MVFVQTLGVLEKEVAAVEHGQPVVLGGGDELLALAQLDDPRHPGQDHLVHIEGLSDKVRGPQLQGLQLRLCVRGEHDDGDVVDFRVLPPDLKHLNAAHHRHHEVQQDDGEVVFPLPDDLQSLDPVLRKEELIVVLQDRGQHVAVDLLIVYHQHALRPLYGIGLQQKNSPLLLD